MYKSLFQNYKKAFKWYKKAAEQGYSKAQYNLGDMYYYGEGVLIDKSKSKYWIKKAYENKNASVSTENRAKKFWEEKELWKY